MKTPIEAVQRQLEAYNDHDLERFVAVYADAVTVFRMPSLEPAISGKAQLAEFYATHRFNVPTLRAEVVNRLAFGNKVIDHERISGLRSETFDVAVVYEVAGGLIQRVWIFGAE